MQPNWLRSVDVSILEYLERHPPEYVPLVANRLGVHLGYAEDRFALLVEEGMVRPVTNESIYTITDEGRRLLVGDEETEQEREHEQEREESPALADD
jgi:predicted transcriptional regulator